MANRITGSGLKAAAADIGVDLATVKTVLDVESSGSGFLPSSKPKILFEGHYFHKFTSGRYDRDHPTISYPKWTKKFYLGGEREWSRFNEAFALDREAAMKSTSWGLGQIMGANYRAAGFKTVGDMVSAVKLGENAQLQMMIDYIQAVHLDDELKAHDWGAFAEGYNGAGYRRNNYDSRLAAAYHKHLRDPDLPMDQVNDHQQEMIENASDDDAPTEPDPTPAAEVPAKPEEPKVVVTPSTPVDASSKKSFWATLLTIPGLILTWLLANFERVIDKAANMDMNALFKWLIIGGVVILSIYLLRQLIMGVTRLIASTLFTLRSMAYHADKNSNNVVVGQPAPPKEVDT